MIKIEHLNKTYKGNTVKALDDINIDIEKGDIYGTKLYAKKYECHLGSS